MSRKPFAPTLLALVLLAGTASTDAAPAGLANEIKGILNHKLLNNATAGVSVRRLSDGEPLVEINNRAPLIPASNLKLLTTAAALDRFGGDFRFQTRLFRRGNDLILVGDGDPSLGDAELLQPLGWSVTTVFDRWAQGDHFAAPGRNVVGDVIVDDSIFDTQFVHPNWPADQLHKRYVAGVAGLNLNANALDFLIQFNGIGNRVGYTINPQTAYIPIENTCVGSRQNAVWLSRDPLKHEIILKGQSPGATSPLSVTIDDPALFAGTVFKESLGRAGVRVTGTVRRDRQTGLARPGTPPEGATLLAIHQTPLPVVLARANKDSMNVYAEALLKRLGADVSGESGSWANGTAAVGAFLKTCGVSSDQFKLDDGCGLSRFDAISADAVVGVLWRMFSSPNRQTYLDSLAVGGVDGTLDDRFKGTDLAGRVHAKSGFIRGVSSLSGYLQAADGQWYAFSILFNGIPEGSNSSIKPLQERIVQAIDRDVR